MTVMEGWSARSSFARDSGHARPGVPRSSPSRRVTSCYASGRSLRRSYFPSRSDRPPLKLIEALRLPCSSGCSIIEPRRHRSNTALRALGRQRQDGTLCWPRIGDHDEACSTPSPARARNLTPRRLPETKTRTVPHARSMVGFACLQAVSSARRRPGGSAQSRAATSSRAVSRATLAGNRVDPQLEAASFSLQTHASAFTALRFSSSRVAPSFPFHSFHPLTVHPSSAINAMLGEPKR